MDKSNIQTNYMGLPRPCYIQAYQENDMVMAKAVLHSVGLVKSHFDDVLAIVELEDGNIMSTSIDNITLADSKEYMKRFIWSDNNDQE